MVQYAACDSPFGPITIGHRSGKIVSIRRCDSPAPHNPSEVTELASIQLQEYFEGKRKCFDLPIDPVGTPFQTAVWKCMLEIPYGEVRTYRQMAAAIGKPGACRAVGQAANRNPIWIVIPCHRVVGGKDALTGYAGGLDMKHGLLELEKNHK